MVLDFVYCFLRRFFALFNLLLRGRLRCDLEFVHHYFDFALVLGPDLQDLLFEEGEDDEHGLHGLVDLPYHPGHLVTLLEHLLLKVRLPKGLLKLILLGNVTALLN